MKLTLLSIFSFLYIGMTAQLNVELLSNVPYDSEGSDVWGYVAPDGSEYAIFGVFDGVSVVNVTDPRNPTEVDFIEQGGSTWRDIKTWGEFAYVTSDQPGTRDGLLVIDMSSLPDSISYVNLNPTIPGGAVINTCHNIYIDEFGFAYLAGCNVNNGGLVIFDVDTTPGAPVLSGLAPNEYSHDVYVRDNKAYSAEINIGVFSVYDVSKKDSITLLAQQTTPFNFTHNLWLSDDGNTIFTTDELANAPVASYDISDLSNIRLLDEYRPSATLNTGVIPHNVHVWDDWLIISYYSDGCIIVDASRPDNLVEVGNFDTFLPNAQGFNGAWGAYPFLPSGVILIGDINDGLFVLGPTYVRAAHLEGNVTEVQSGAGINGAQILVDALNLIEFSRADGSYKTGSHSAGSYSVTASAFGYRSETKTVEFVNGELINLDFELESLPRVTLNGTVLDAATSDPVANSKIKLNIDGNETEIDADENGMFSLPNTLVGNYDIIAGQWGYKYTVLEDYAIEASGAATDITIMLEEGIEDIFSLDLGWASEFLGNQGMWERGNPIGQSPAPDAPIAPEDDSDDPGSDAYVTGNATDFFSGLLFGQATLRSPVFDASTIEKPTISYQTWLWASDFNGNPTSNVILVSLSNGTETAVIDTISLDLNFVFQWNKSDGLLIEDFMTPSDSMTLSVVVTQNAGNRAVEAGFDDFKVYAGSTVDLKEIELIAGFTIAPNPSDNAFFMEVPQAFRNNGQLQVYSASGQLIESILLGAETNINFGRHLLKGMYMVQLVNSELRSQAIKLMKI